MARARVLLALLLCWLCAQAVAATVDLAAPPAGPLGLSMSVLHEDGRPMDIDAARAALAAGSFRPATRAVPGFGIDGPPAWAHLVLRNDSGRALLREVRVGNPWTDRLDAWFVRDGRVVAHVAAGDGAPGLLPPRAGSGHVFTRAFPPGDTELFLRAATPDPLALPVTVHDVPAGAREDRWVAYGYGLLYGWLLALVAYNALLWTGLRARSHLDYALYLGCFILLNAAYTGHGYAYLWPGAHEFQRYVILVLMVLFTCAGLRFASGFLGLALRSPRLDGALRLACRGSCALMALAVLLGQQGMAARLAFVVALAGSLTVFLLALRAALQRQETAGYFFAAVAWGMVGSFVTTLAVWGVLPHTPLTYHAFEIGVATEAALLALAVAWQVRAHQQARLHAEELAATDPLTGLLNMRAFLQQGDTLQEGALRGGRPLALLVLDIDHFGSVNRRHGHAAGDRVLQAFATQLLDACRRGDLVARRGGAEFALLLQDTTLGQALGLGERLRRQVAALATDAGPLLLTASIGVCVQDGHADIEALLADADTWLQRAKKAGGDRASGPWAPLGGSGG